jgi:hypothetical protein
MESNDLTIIYITANQIPETFAAYQRGILSKSAKGAHIISISRKPLHFGTNLLDDGEKSTDNIYRQMLRGAKIATTKYVAMAEDDTLYNEDHFYFFRPDDDTFAYNQNRLALFTWGKPQFNWRNRKSNCSLIAPRELLVESLEERFTRWPTAIPEILVGELGRQRVEKNLGVTVRKSIEVFSEISIIQFNHDNASENAQRAHRKRPGPIKAYDIPYWGKAQDLVRKYV